MKLRYLLFALLAGSALLSSAEAASDPMYMVLTMRDGQHKAVNIVEVNRLTFTNGTMNVEKKNATSENIVLTDIYCMEFSENETGGVADVAVRTSSLAYNGATSTLHFDGADGQELAIYSINGALMLRFTTDNGSQTLDLSDLASGAYIVTYNGQSLKFVK